MKLTISIPALSGRARRGKGGFMIIAMMAILAMMLIYVAASLRSLSQLRQDLKLVEQKQVQRLQSPTPTATRTNATAIAP
jgi:hypothetical protein